MNSIHQQMYLASLQLCTNGRVCLQHRGDEGERKGKQRQNY